MTIEQLNKLLGNIDIYLLDQILKNKIPSNASVLDAGCGEGRNLIYFLNNGFEVTGIDKSPDAIRLLQFIIGSTYAHVDKNNFTVGDLARLPYASDRFDYVICSAVLHFARSEAHFWDMIGELHRVLRPEGALFIRMTSNIGLSGQVPIKNGLYQLPDGSQRFLITEAMIAKIIDEYQYSKMEPVKTVVVEGQRCMTTLVLQKNKRP